MKKNNIKKYFSKRALFFVASLILFYSSMAAQVLSENSAVPQVSVGSTQQPSEKLLVVIEVFKDAGFSEEQIKIILSELQAAGVSLDSLQGDALRGLVQKMSDEIKKKEGAGKVGPKKKSYSFQQWIGVALSVCAATIAICHCYGRIKKNQEILNAGQQSINSSANDSVKPRSDRFSGKGHRISDNPV